MTICCSHMEAYAFHAIFAQANVSEEMSYLFISEELVHYNWSTFRRIYKMPSRRGIVFFKDGGKGCWKCVKDLSLT